MKIELKNIRESINLLNDRLDICFGNIDDFTNLMSSVDDAWTDSNVEEFKETVNNDKKNIYDLKSNFVKSIKICSDFCDSLETLLKKYYTSSEITTMRYSKNYFESSYSSIDTAVEDLNSAKNEISDLVFPSSTSCESQIRDLLSDVTTDTFYNVVDEMKGFSNQLEEIFEISSEEASKISNDELSFSSLGLSVTGGNSSMMFDTIEAQSGVVGVSPVDNFDFEEERYSISDQDKVTAIGEGITEYISDSLNSSDIVNNIEIGSEKIGDYNNFFEKDTSISSENDDFSTDFNGSISNNPSIEEEYISNQYDLSGENVNIAEKSFLTDVNINSNNTSFSANNNETIDDIHSFENNVINSSNGLNGESINNSDSAPLEWANVKLNDQNIKVDTDLYVNNNSINSSTISSENNLDIGEINTNDKLTTNTINAQDSFNLDVNDIK